MPTCWPDSRSVSYVHVTNELGNAGDGIYKSSNGGTAFSKIFSSVDQRGLSFLARRDGTCVAPTWSSGAFTSSACDIAWTDVVNPPHIGCLVENAAGSVFACTDNYGGDGFGIMRSSDLTAWTGVLRYQDISGPVACAPGSLQHDSCEVSTWCALATQLSISSPECQPAVDGAPIDAPPDGPSTMRQGHGCCDAGEPRGSALLALFVVLVTRKRR